MICEICHKTFALNLSFNNIFKFDFICNKCIKNIQLKYTIIPLSNGYQLFYYYVLTDPIIEEDVKELEFNYLKYILSKHKKSIFLDLDEYSLFLIKNINFHQDIVLFSITYLPLEDLICEDF